MSRQYGLQSGLPELPPADLPEQQARLVLPLYQALNSLAMSTSDAAGLTQISVGDIQNASPNLQYRDGGNILNLEAAVDIAPGRFVGLDTTAGEARLVLANNSTGSNRKAVGFCIEGQTITAGTRGRVRMFQGLLTGATGILPGIIYWIATNGQITAIQPGGVGVMQQPVGIGISSSMLYIQMTL